MNRIGKKILSVLLCMSLVCSMAAVCAFASTGDMVRLGDVNASDTVNAVDARFVLQSAANMRQFSEAESTAADRRENQCSGCPLDFADCKRQAIGVDAGYANRCGCFGGAGLRGKLPRGGARVFQFGAEPRQTVCKQCHRYTTIQLD